MKLLFLAPSRRSRGEALLAADLARALPRAGFEVGFLAAEESIPYLHELGFPALPLSESTGSEVLAQLDEVVRGFKPDCLFLADAFSAYRSCGPAAAGPGALRERYACPVVSFDRLGWQAAGYTADFYGGERVRFPKLLDECDAVVRTSPPLPPGPVSPGIVAAPLHLGPLRDGGLRATHAQSPDINAAEDGRPTVFLVDSPWERRNPTRSLPVAQLIDALPKILHGHLASLGRPLRVVHVGPRKWRFAPAEHIEYRHYGKLPYTMFHEWLSAADLFLTSNVLSVTLAQAVLAGTPALVLRNSAELTAARLPDWIGSTAPLLDHAYPFHVAPLGWYELLEPMLADNPYQDAFAAAAIFDRPSVLEALGELLEDTSARSALGLRQQALREQLAGLPPIGEALKAAVSR